MVTCEHGLEGAPVCGLPAQVKVKINSGKIITEHHFCSDHGLEYSLLATEFKMSVDVEPID